MLQAVVAYAVVAFAAGWVAWSMFIPRTSKVKLRRRRLLPR